MQKSYNSALTNLYRKLYVNEYEIDYDNNYVDLNSLKVSLPSPTNLNMTNLSDQLSTVSSIIDFVSQTIIGSDSNNDPKYADNVKRIVTKKYVTNVDWNEIEKLIEADLTIPNLEKEVLSKQDTDSSDSSY